MLVYINTVYIKSIYSHTRIYEDKQYARKKIPIQKEKEITYKVVTSIDSKSTEYIKHMICITFSGVLIVVYTKKMIVSARVRRYYLLLVTCIIDVVSRYMTMVSIGF